MKPGNVHWSLYFLLWLGGISALGAVVGAVAFMIGGGLFGENRSPLSLALEGGRRVGFVFSIWAPAISLVACVRRAYRRRHPGATSGD